jgi:acetyl-CoA carboxylase carboxyltransferase component
MSTVEERRARTTPSERLDGLEDRRLAAASPGSDRARDRQRGRGRLLARERIDHLLDDGSFNEIGMLARHAVGDRLAERPHTDGVITGFGTILGRAVYVYAQDVTVFGGALGQAHAEKVNRVLDLAADAGLPVIGLNDGGGARIQEGVSALASYGRIFARHVRASGVTPQISVILGPCAGGGVYSPALTDFVFMVEGTSSMFLTGPDVVRSVTGEEVTVEELGGAGSHSRLSGVATFVAADERSCLDDVRYLLSFLPSNNLDEPPITATDDAPTRPTPSLRTVLPTSARVPYDVRTIIAEVADDGEFLEYQQRWAPNLVCGFVRLAGRPVGVVANQPDHLAGVLDIDASDKGARFVRTCDAFNIALVTIVDVPGFLPGTDQEYNGIIRHGAKLLYAYCEASVPRIQVITRKAFGGAYIVMDCKAIGADFSYAWPTAEIAVMGASGAVNVLDRRQIAAADDPDAMRSELERRYEDEFLNPWEAADANHIDEVIDPAETRARLIAALSVLRSKREDPPHRKHGNMPV